jgi:hypothetical protein
MADEQNIRQENNTAQLGLNQDQTLNQIKPGTLTYALNAMVENFDSNSVNYQNEPGNDFCVSFPEDYVLIGNHFINEQNKHIFLLTNPMTGNSEFGYMINGDCVYRKLIDSDELGWNIKYPIHKIVHRITNCSTEIYWPDNIARRYMDIDNIPYKLAETSELCDPQYTNELDVNQLSMQPKFSIPDLEVKDVDTGGEIEAGVYQFTIQYGDASSNPFTSYYSVTNPTPISDPFRTTVNFNYTVGKSIIVDIKDLDTTGQFQYFNLAVIKTINGVSSPELVGTYFIDNPNKTIIYTGQKVDNIRLSMNDIFEKFPYYEIASDLTAVQDVLVWDGLTSVDRINYQSIASKITLQWETYELPVEEDYSDELNSTNLRSFLRDEVYPFEIVYLLDNGKQTDGFHIPGREISVADQLHGIVLETDSDFIGEPTNIDNVGVGSSPYWKIYNTATVLGNLSPTDGEKINNATPYQYGDFSYWESTDIYPCNEDVWGELSGKPIRHHKFPDVLISPISRPSIEYNGTLTIQRDYIYPIGVRINIDQIKALIDTSELTLQQKNQIVGFKIIRGDRATNKSIVAKGMLRNVNKYVRESQTFFFPNYPYNDLEEDPFLNSTNNAWTLVAEPFIINVMQFNLPEDAPIKTYFEVKYTDPNTNKEATQPYYELGEHILCSVTVPVIQGMGVKNKMFQTAGGPHPDAINVGTVGYANYDIYTVERCHAHGVRALFYDSVEGPTSVWCKGSLGSGTRKYTIHVKRDTTPTQGDGKGTLCSNLIEEVRIDDCSVNNPLQAITDIGIEPYRQIFNSPETSFGQPFLGNVLKIENVMYGAGKAHFVEVKDNAKYRLLTMEAQEDALTSSNNLGKMSDPFNASAMFSAYQSYLEIYLNGITRKNYAYSFNSIASYDYSAVVGNNGNKQRMLDISRYLIPGVQNVGDLYNINNYQRESSVFLKTDEDKPALLYPSDVTTLPTGIKDHSRFTISGSGKCSTPALEQDISVVSYYASLKNIFVNQWGQIYSYEIVDTGFQRKLSDGGQSVLFGGDTFISKFAYKTKLPFFIDNRVNAPDDSDIFYDEIGNIAYPKYWHSARSILKDFGADGVGNMSNIISYKAHNFDCPNSQVLVPEDAAPDTNPNRTYYDGYFYLFAYGIPYFYCETSYNVDLRQATNNREGDFWPHVSTGIPDDWVQESFVSIINDNTYNYNITYSKQNKETSFTHLPPDWSDQLCFTNYPFRAIYSDSQNTDADNRVNSWLTYRALSYYDFPQNYGKLISLDGIQNKAVLARFENKTLMYNNLLTIDTSNPQAAYVGNPNMFKGAPPIDFAETDLGYVGTQHKMLLRIPQGQITVDAKRGQVFLINGTSAQDLSGFGSGLNKFFTHNLPFNILNYFPDADIDNHFNGIGLHGVHDSNYDRILITKLDYKPLSDDIKYNNETKEYYIEEDLSENVTVIKKVDLNDPDFFCNKSWTLSFNMNTKSWISFHSYLPNWYIGENNYFYSGLNGCCDEFDFVAGTIIPTPSTTTTTTTPIPTTTTTTTLFVGCDLEGNIVRTYCDIEGTGIITTPPTCKRPLGLNEFTFITGYEELPSGPIVDSTGSQSAACAAVAFINGEPDLDDPTYEMTGISGYTNFIELGSKVYLGNDTDDCTVIPNGWYFLEEQLEDSIVMFISGGIILIIENCLPSTTTTTTTVVLVCSTYTATKATVGTVNINYIDCSGVPQTETVGNPGGGISTKTFCASNITGLGEEVSLTYNGAC